jgi:signal transduction histidine kinase
VTKVSAIVRAALDSSRPSSAPRERVDFAALVNRVCQMAGPMIEDAGIRVQVTVPDQSVDIVADAVHLELALLNLISNSVDAMEPGGRLAVRLACVGDRLRLEVEDTGTGIPPELLAHIFEPWVTTKALGKGSGLGLSIARQVVVSHGGTIRAENRSGQGAVFTIELPAAQGRSPHAHTADAENSHR